MNRGGTASTKELVVGRSRQCDMVLDYRYYFFTTRAASAARHARSGGETLDQNAIE